MKQKKWLAMLGVTALLGGASLHPVLAEKEGLQGTERMGIKHTIEWSELDRRTDVFQGKPIKIQRKLAAVDRAELTSKGAIPFKMKEDRFIHMHFPESLLEFLGIDEETLQEELRAGKSLLELAKEQGITEEEWKAYHLEQFHKQLDLDVERGFISKEQAEKIKEQQGERFIISLHDNRVEWSDEEVERDILFRYNTRMEKLEELGSLPHAPRMVKGDRMIRFSFPEAILELLGVDEESLLEQLREGKTIEEIAQAQGVSQEALRELFREEISFEFKTKQRSFKGQPFLIEEFRPGVNGL